MSEYVKLVCRNDWGRTAYTLEGKGMSEHGTFRISGNPDIAVFSIHQPLTVMTPNGTIASGVINFVPRYAHVTDHGHDCSFWEQVPVLEFDLDGVRAKADLETLMIRRSDLVFQGDSP